MYVIDKKEKIISFPSPPLIKVDHGFEVIIEGGICMVDREGLVCHTTFFSPRGPYGKMYYAMIVAHFAGVEKYKKSMLLRPDK